jgi:anti-sigma-K factor RskA
MSHDLGRDGGHVQDAAAYVLGALDEHEADEFRRHLEDCAACRQEVADLAPIVALLPATAPPVAAPPELQARLMATVRSESELLQAAGAGADRVPRSAPSSRWWARPPRAALAAAAVLAAVVGALVATGGGTSVRETRAAVSVPGASAVLRQTGSRSEIVVSRMPPPASGHVYQLWTKRANAAPVPTDVLFEVNRAGGADVDVPGSLHGVSRLMVTTEPAGGSQKPTTAPVLTVTPRSS